MKASRAVPLTYTGALIAAAALHIAVAAGLGGVLGRSADRAPPVQPAGQERPLSVRLRRPQAAEPQSPRLAPISRPPVGEPLPSPTPRPALHEPPAPGSLEEPPAAPPAPEGAVDPPLAAAAGPSAEKPRPLRPIDAEAVYPLGSRLRGEEGAVRLLLRIDAGGRLLEVRVTGSSGFPALDQAAERAVRRGRFAPATVEGRPVSGELSVTIRFRLDS